MTNTDEFPGEEDVEIVVGDEKQQDFKPRMKIKRWDNEVNFSVGLITERRGGREKVGEKVEWNDEHGTKARFYQKPGEEFEFEIELAEKPATNTILLSIETKGLRFLYQPPLTQKEIDDGCERPDNVVGSYAVYHKTMKGNYVGGKNYRAGKAFHIYRPHVTDAEGKREWCDMDITGSMMRITVPDGLTYPVIIDPTFGVDPASPGGSWDNSWRDYLQGSVFTSPADILTAQSISFYMREVAESYSGAAAAYDVKGLIVLKSNKNIITNGIGGPVTVPAAETGAWFTSVFGTDPSLSNSTEYILCKLNNGDDGSGFPPWSPAPEIAYDVGAVDQDFYDNSNSYTSPTHPTDAVFGMHDYEYSFYVTYTPLPSAPSAGMQPLLIALFGG